MITFGDVVKAFRTGEMTDELRDLDVTTVVGILSGKPYRRVSVYNTAEDKYERICKAANSYNGNIEDAPNWLKPYLECTGTERAAVGAKVKNMMHMMEREYGGHPIHPTAVKLVLCNDKIEREHDFLIESLIDDIHND